MGSNLNDGLTRGQILVFFYIKICLAYFYYVIYKTKATPTLVKRKVGYTPLNLLSALKD